MKKLRSSEDLDAYGKDPNPNPSPGPNPYPSRTSSSTSHRSFYYNKPDTVRKGLLSSSSSASSLTAAARRGDDDRDAAAVGGGASRMVRKRPAAEHEFEVGFERRKGVDRYGRDGGGGYDRSVMHRSESFSGGGGGSRRGSEFPKGFRSERDRSRREGAWCRRGGGSGRSLRKGGVVVVGWRRELKAAAAAAD